MDYSSTLNLPRTNFPMRAGLAKKEPQILETWEKLDLYQKMRENRKGSPKFILHDGPPYANGSIHMGTALNKVLKDIINKYKYMRGYDVPYVPGWDTHGLPIEHQVIKNKKINRNDITELEFRRMCREYALQYLDIQREQFKRLGVIGDWENPYVTLKPDYEATQIGVFGKMAEKGYIYKGLKPVYWCPQCETALAEAEIEYAERRSPSIYVKFPVTDNLGLWDERFRPAFVMIWTTTPWTIPANLAIAMHPDYNYVLVRAVDEYYLLAEELLKDAFAAIGLEEGDICGRYKGSELEGLVCRHPLYDRSSKVLLADYVTLEQGTGCVHIAPGHGLEDYETGLQYDLPIYAPMDGKGIFTSEAGEFAGLRYDEGNKAVTAALEREHVLLKLSFLTHQYPHCWRCKKEVIFRATEQWFASIQQFREDALHAVKEVNWIPSWGEGRMNNMIAERRDWCISRQRVWGVPIPVFYCESCGEALLTPESVAAVQEIFKKEGSDAWFFYKAEEILPENISCSSCGERKFRKEQDIMDVWFDSGSSHAAVVNQREELNWPADLYLEGSDQFRGWFQSSLLTAVAVMGKPPYRNVLSHGWVVDGEGRKMSKSLGNVIVPEDVIKNYGADILRLWVSSADFTSDVHLSSDILKQLSEIYRKIRNTCRFLLGNCSDFVPERDRVDYSQLEEIDRWALHRLYKLVQKTTRAFENYEYHQVFHALHNFAVVDMSNFYFDITKDRLYVLAEDSRSRRAVQTVLAEVLQTLTLLISPVLSFTAEEIWSYIPFKNGESVMLASWPDLPSYYQDEELAERWEVILQLREEVNRSLELARKEKIIGSSLQALVELYPDDELYGKLADYESLLPAVLIVSSTRLHEPGVEPEGDFISAQELGLRLKVEPAPGKKCQRCWVYSPTVGQDKENEEVCSRCGEILSNFRSGN
ncbi:MAG TPA: isoleucine--tRNA ligase [Firmicutes bacterium]|jgi:isoleucyl-tRNA synthetase|nr:isoleucine--tRNA ligase [Bacillota bacterium]